MELEKIAGSLYVWQPSQTQKLDRELDRLAAVLEETGTAVLASLEKARYRKEKDPEAIKEYRRAYRLLRKEIESIEQCRAVFAAGKAAAEAVRPAQPKERIDYEQYRVDETVAYSLDSVTTNKKPAAFSLNGVRYEAGSWKQVLLQTCALLNRMDPMLFASLERDPDLQGRKRPYFSGNGEGLDTPAKVPDADVYVETHVSARYLKKMIQRLLYKFGIPADAYRIYLRKDFTALHTDEARSGAGAAGRAGAGGSGRNTADGALSGQDPDGALSGQISLFDWEEGEGFTG